jgi:hypothetical protein
MKETHQRAGISHEDFILAATKAIACLVTYRITTHGLSHCLNHADDLLGGMWVAVATAFVFRKTRSESLAVGVSRLIATSASFLLCQV